MYKAAHTRYGDIPIQFVPDISAEATDIVEDGKAVVEATPAEADESAILDAKVEHIKDEIKANNQIIEAKVATRQPKQITGAVIPPGSGGLGLTARDPMDQRHTAADLAPERAVDESKEKEITVSKADDGSKKVS
jgi:hypothetical protein